MHILLVTVQVKPEAVEAFKAAILDNAQASIQEPGVVRFDVLQQAEDPTCFTLYEVYHSRRRSVETSRDSALPALERYGGRDDGRAAPGDPLHQPGAGRREVCQPEMNRFGYRVKKLTARTPGPAWVKIAAVRS